VGELMNHIKNLSWNVANELQSEAIEELSKTTSENISKLIMPLQKDCWENAALVLSGFSDSLLEQVFMDLLTWLQDLSWPGSLIVMKRLAQMNKEAVEEKIQLAISQAITENEEEWKDNLEMLLEKLK